MKPRDELLRPADVEAEYGISVSTLSTWRRRTRESGSEIGPRWMKAGPRRISYRRSVVDAWLAGQQQQAAS